MQPTNPGYQGPPLGFPANPPGVPANWRPIGDSTRPNGSNSVVFVTPNGKSFTVNNMTGAIQKGQHWGNQ